MDVRLQVGQVAVQMQEKGGQSSWVSAQKRWQKTVRESRVWGGFARSDRGLEGNSRAQIAVLKETGAV